MSAVPHDFTKPVRLSPEWQQRLGGWLRQALALANQKWGKELPFAMTGSLLAVDVDYAPKHLSTLPDHVLGYRIRTVDRRVPSFLTLPRLSMIRLVGALLGDDSAASADREMTLIEENLADYFVAQVWLPFFREAWPMPPAGAWELQERDPNPRSTRFFSVEESLIVMNWRLVVPWGDIQGAWAFQRKALLESLGDKTAANQAAIAEPVLKARRDILVQALPLVVSAVLARVELRISDLSKLQVGDVVLLDRDAQDPVIVQSGGRDLFRGRPGRLGLRKAFRIDSLGAG